MQSMGSATADTAGSALSTAAANLLNYLDANGVPSEHINDPQVNAYQQAWNADPANSADQLSVDGGYGPETQGTLNVLTGGIAPAVNTGPPGTTPVSPTPVTPTPVTPAPVTPAKTDSEVGFWILLAAVGVGAYLLLRKKKGKTVHHHHPASAAIELRSNPRRRRRNGAELIP